MKKPALLPALLFMILLAAACAVPASRAIRQQYRQLSAAERREADSLLAYALDHEALFTLADTLKPMSSMQLKRLPLLSLVSAQQDSARQALQRWQQLAARLSNQWWVFIVNPFERSDSIYKYAELYVVRRQVLAQLLQNRQDFYAALGLSSAADPATVLATTEYEQKYQRWRSYGYLFGYPAHAVDFFVNAGRQQDSTGQFVERSFFAIPVFAGAKGYFTYAVPKDYQPQPIDSNLYKVASQRLQQYQQLRQRYSTAQGLQATRLWRALQQRP